MSTIYPCKVAVFKNAHDAAAAMGDGFWDDNGGETDGRLYICSETDLPLPRPEGVRVVDGFMIDGYSGAYDDKEADYCGWQCQDVAFTASYELAQAIAKAENDNE